VLNKKILIIFLTGLFLRLLLMPFALQADLISANYRAHLISEYGLMGIKSNQPLINYVYATNLLTAKLFYSDIKSFFAESHGVSTTSTTSSVGDWLSFVNNKQVNSFVFFLKIPHLLADIALFFLLGKLFAKHQKKLLILSLWWFNPVNLYSFYVFARYDSLTILTLLLATVLISKNKITSGLLALLAAIQLRFQPILYLPLFLISSWKKIELKHFFRNILLTGFIFFGVLFLENNLPYDQHLYQQVKNIETNQLVTQTAPQETNITKITNLLQSPYLLATSVGGKSTLNKLIIFTILFAITNFLYLFTKENKDPKESLLKLNSVLYLSLALYFLVNDFSPHYFVWLSGFATIAVVIHKQFLPAYSLAILGWLIMGIFSTGNFAITQNLFLPVSPLLFNTPQIGYVVPQAAQLFNLGRLILNLGLIWSGFIAARYLFKDMHQLKDWKKVFKLGLLSLISFIFIFPNRIEAAKLPVYKQETMEKVFLEPGIIYQNQFTVVTSEFGSLDLKFDTGRSRENHQLLFRLKEINSSNWYYQATYNTADFYNHAFYPIGFPTITYAMNKTYLYEVEILDQPDLPFAIYHNSYVVSKEGSLKELSSLIKQDLTAKWTNQQPFFIFWLSLLAINLVALLVVIVKKWDNQSQ